MQLSLSSQEQQSTSVQGRMIRDGEPKGWCPGKSHKTSGKVNFSWSRNTGGWVMPGRNCFLLPRQRPVLLLAGSKINLSQQHTLTHGAGDFHTCVPALVFGEGRFRPSLGAQRCWVPLTGAWSYDGETQTNALSRRQRDPEPALEPVQPGHHRCAASLLGRLIWPLSLAGTRPALQTHLLLTKAQLLHQRKTTPFTASPPALWAAGEGSSVAGHKAGPTVHPQTHGCSIPMVMDSRMAARPAWTSPDHRRGSAASEPQLHRSLQSPGLGIAPPALPGMIFPDFPSLAKVDA